MKSNRSISIAGKYREIVLAVAFFLVFDLAVLVLNFYISYQISGDAVAINLSGRQRMLSQRMTKSLYDADGALAVGRSPEESLKEAQLAGKLFGETLRAFSQGGEVASGTGKRIHLEAVENAQGQALINRARDRWEPLEAALGRLAPSPNPDPALLSEAVKLARDENLKLLGIMNELTTELEQVANAKADRLRQIQTGGITLALLNFLFILFKFIRRLREGDRKLEAAQQETDEILATVSDGLFLLDQDLRVGSQFSGATARVLGRELQPGDHFRSFLAQALPPRERESAEDFIGLLFGQRVVESLVDDLNPMTRIQLGKGDRWASFRFNRVRDGDHIPHLLVTVQDVTRQVQLARDLETAKAQAKNEMAILLDLLKVNPDLLGAFLDKSRETLDYVNQRLQNLLPGHHRHLIDLIFRNIHSLKGEAATLGLSLFEQEYQSFETSLRSLRELSQPTGEDMLVLMPHLAGAFERIQQVGEMLARLQRFHSHGAAERHVSTEEFVRNLQGLAHRIAGDHNKEVKVETDLESLSALNSEQRAHIHDIMVQCLRNAVVHGIEGAQERASSGKSAAGLVKLRLARNEEGEFELECRDDGRGLDPARIRRALLEKKLYSEEALEQLSDQQVVMKIFEPGVSTHQGDLKDAGQGVGLELVRERINQLGGHLRLASRRGAFTSFSLRFSPS